VCEDRPPRSLEFALRRSHPTVSSIVSRLASRFWIAPVLTALACQAGPSEPVSDALQCRGSSSCVAFTSFESGSEGWVSRAADAGAWTITRVTDRARDAQSSMRLAASNTTDDTKLWLQREVLVKPNTAYAVRLEYAFCCVSYDPSAFNPFQYVADVRAIAPTDTHPVFQFYPVSSPDDSSAAGPVDANARWRHKRFDLVARSGDDGRLYVSAGLVHGFEITFQYWIDSIRLTVVPQG